MRCLGSCNRRIWRGHSRRSGAAGPGSACRRWCTGWCRGHPSRAACRRQQSPPSCTRHNCRRDEGRAGRVRGRGVQVREAVVVVQRKGGGGGGVDAAAGLASATSSLVRVLHFVDRSVHCVFHVVPDVVRNAGLGGRGRQEQADTDEQGQSNRAPHPGCELGGEGPRCGRRGGGGDAGCVACGEYAADW